MRASIAEADNRFPSRGSTAAFAAHLKPAWYIDPGSEPEAELISEANISCINGLLTRNSEDSTNSKESAGDSRKGVANSENSVYISLIIFYKMTAEDRSNLIRTYHHKKTSGSLSDNLTNPSPGKLRAECLIVYGEKGEPQDDYTLRLFFEPKSTKDNYRELITAVDIDKFRPLVSLLKGKQITPHNKHYSLLAWLISYETGPDKSDDFPSGKSIVENDADAVEEKINLPKEMPGKKSGQKKTAGAVRFKKAIIAFFVIVFTGSGTLLLLNNRIKECMYWDGDHYQAISCDQKIGETPSFALDTQQLNYFRKITRPDTLSRRSIGNVWYSKINNVLEFYTADGFHPVHRDRKLKPLTDHILKTYITGKNSSSVTNN